MSTFENTIITIETFLDKEFSSVETSGSTTGMAHILQNVCQGTNQEATIHRVLTSKELRTLSRELLQYMDERGVTLERNSWPV